MSFDPSRQLYTHWKCNSLPCKCTYIHQELQHELLKCTYEGCSKVFDTATERGNHHLEVHESKSYVERLPQEFVPQVSGSNGVHK